MAFQQGNKLGGRKNGSKNRTTEEIRIVFKELLENNLQNIQEWLNQTADKDPKAALELTIKLSEFVIPKLARTTLDSNNFDNFKDGLIKWIDC